MSNISLIEQFKTNSIAYKLYDALENTLYVDEFPELWKRSIKVFKEALKLFKSCEKSDDELAIALKTADFNNTMERGIEYMKGVTRGETRRVILAFGLITALDTIHKICYNHSLSTPAGKIKKEFPPN